jgi:hypothetical protein
MPVGDGVDIELCSTCDAGRGAAGQLIALLEVPESERSVQALGDLMMTWTREAMAAKGWGWIPHPRTSLN